mgnify:CR=1 FL=1
MTNNRSPCDDVVDQGDVVNVTEPEGEPLDLILYVLDEDFVYPDSVEGVNVKWLNLTYSNQLNYLQRIIVFLKYIIYSAFLGLKFDYDVIYASSSPLTIGLSAVFLKKWKRKKLVFEVRDIPSSLYKALGGFATNGVNLIKLES